MSGGVRSIDDFAAWAADHARGITFAGPNPEYAIGLEHLLPGYGVATADRAPALEILGRRGTEVFVLADVDPMEAAGARSTRALLAAPATAEFVDRRGAGHLLVFKPAHDTEALCAARGWRLLAPPSSVARRWENKLSFLETGTRMGLPLPPGRAVDPQRETYADVAADLGDTFVLQAAHGYGGVRTARVVDEATWRGAVGYLRSRPLRATTFVPGTPLTQNACVTERGVAASSPFGQLTGARELTPYRLGSCGNDWSWPQLRRLDPEPYVRIATAVGEALSGHGYRGVFGLDYVRDADGRPVLVEVNPRLVASIALFTQLELMAGRLPLLARHLVAHLDPSADGAPLDGHLGPLEGGQAIVHHVGASPATVAATMDVGAHRVDGGALQWVRPAIRVDELEPGEVLVLPPALGATIGAGAAFARLQWATGVMDDHADPAAHVLAAVSDLRQRVELRGDHAPER